MKTALLVLLSFGAVAFAQDAKKDNTPSRDREAPESRNLGAKRRLDSVTWDLKNHKLVWVVQSGSEVNGKFVASGSDRYEIEPDKAIMMFADEKRGFTEQEAASLHRLLDVLSLYCAESVMWWDQGEGEPVGPNGKPKRQQLGDPDATPRKVEKPQQRAEPGRLMVARASGAE